jgi:hypothetical protein
MTKLTVLPFFRCERAKNVADNRMRELRVVAVNFINPKTLVLEYL